MTSLIEAAAPLRLEIESEVAEVVIVATMRIRPRVLVDRAKSALRTFALRDKVFSTPGLFGDPAWSILLDLYIAEAEDRAIAIGSACIASGSPHTTGLRYVYLLEKHGFLERYADPGDRRRHFLRLTNRARSHVERVLE